MDNFDKLNEPVISSSGRKRKVKAEMFYEALQKQCFTMVREKLSVLRVIKSIQFMITTTTCLSGIYIVV